MYPRLVVVALCAVFGVLQGQFSEESGPGSDKAELLPEIPQSDLSPLDSGVQDSEIIEQPKVNLWGYDGAYPPERWYELNNTCGTESTQQSPINIDTSNTIFDDDLEPITFRENINRLHKTSMMVRKWHSVGIHFPHEVFVEGGDMPSRGYQAMGVKFAWGSEDNVGSEHQVNGAPYPLEMHIYSYDTTRFAQMSDAFKALNSNDGLAIFSVFFELAEEDNPDFLIITNNLKRLRNKVDEDDWINVAHVPLASLLPRDTRRYYRYHGSLSVPPCYEIVMWTVFHQTLPISKAQLDEFRQLQVRTTEGSTKPLVDNYRPIQAVNDRIVYRSFLQRTEISRAEVVPGDLNNAAVSSVQFQVAALYSLFFYLVCTQL